MKLLALQRIQGVIAVMLWLEMGAAPLFAIDLGVAVETPDKPQKVEVVDQPVKVTPQDEGAVIEISPDIALDPSGIYESEYIDVRAFRSITFYVIPKEDSSVNIKSSTEESPAQYQLEAFFSPKITGAAKLMTFGDDQPKWINQPGSQEFGALAVDKEGNEGSASFIKLSTGRTHSRCLSTPVYGPYIRVVLRNFTDKDKQHYQIMAYLSH